MKPIFLLLLAAALLWECDVAAQVTLWDQVPGFFVPVNPSTPGQAGVIQGKNDMVLAGGTKLAISTDRGKSWTTINSFPGTGTISDISIWDDNTFAVSSYGRNVHFTADKGQTWKTVNAFVVNGIIALTYLDSPDHFAIIDDRGTVAISLDRGLTFNTDQHGSDLGDLEYASDGTLYHLTYFDNQKKPGLFATTDFGASWAQLFPTGAGDNWSMESDPSDPNRLMIFEEEVYVANINFAQIHLSTDRGTTWTVTSRKPVRNLNGAAAIGCHDYFAGTIDEGVLRSGDKGLSWTSIGGPAGGVDSRSVTALDDSSIFVLEATGELWLTRPLSFGSGATIDFRPLVSVSTDTIGGDIILPISSIYVGGSATMKFTLHFDERAVDYLGTFSADNKDLTVSRPTSSSASIEFDPKKDTAFFARFSFFPVDSVCVPIVIDSIAQAFNSSSCYRIAVIPASLTTDICYVPDSCGRQNIARFLRFGTKPTLRIVPNPTTGDVTVYCDKEIERRVEIVDMEGKVRKTFGNMTIAKAGTRLSTENLPSGNYLIRAGEYTANFVKEK